MKQGLRSHTISENLPLTYHQPHYRATAAFDMLLHYTLLHWLLTSQPFGVILHCTQHGAAFTQTSVNNCVTCQEVSHGGRVEITT